MTDNEKVARLEEIRTELMDMACGCSSGPSHVGTYLHQAANDINTALKNMEGENILPTRAMVASSLALDPDSNDPLVEQMIDTALRFLEM